MKPFITFAFILAGMALASPDAEVFERQTQCAHRGDPCLTNNGGSSPYSGAVQTVGQTGRGGEIGVACSTSNYDVEVGDAVIVATADQQGLDFGNWLKVKQGWGQLSQQASFPAEFQIGCPW
ncbi:hypothetical protein E4U55_008096 [Claviceps digitariae]|nr:hypothetical protein E4U55_008096 [Claviceps digitariae]